VVLFSGLLALGATGSPELARAQQGDATEPQPAGGVLEANLPPPGSDLWPHACSQRHPICVSGSTGTRASYALGVLGAAERAWDTLTQTLGLPPPDPQLDGVWHVYVVDSAGAEATSFLGDRDVRAHFDRASSYALVSTGTPPGCALDLALARAVARGSLWREAPAIDPGSAIAETEALARLATPCAGADGALEAFQARPERTLVDPSDPGFDRGASLFFDWLDTTFGAEPGALVTGLWALAASRTPPGAWRWTAVPSGFDVLRKSLAGALWDGSTLDDVVVRFAVERANVSPPPHLAWHVPWPSRPRRLASPEPPSPTGASYVVVDHAGAPQGAVLRVEAEWEHYGRMRWVVLKMDAAGHAAAVVPVTSLDRGTRASMNIEKVDDADRVMVVGVNVGSTEHPFDPYQGEWEPHGWLLTLTGQ